MPRGDRRWVKPGASGWRNDSPRVPWRKSISRFTNEYSPQEVDLSPRLPSSNYSMIFGRKPGCPTSPLAYAGEKDGAEYLGGGRRGCRPAIPGTSPDGTGFSGNACL